MATRKRIQSHLSDLIRAVLVMRRCAAEHDSGCSLLCFDEHLNTVYKRAEEAETFLQELEKAPS